MSCVYYTRCVVVCQALTGPFRIVCEVESTRAIALMILEALCLGLGFGFAGAILALAPAPRCRVLFLCHLLLLLVLLLGLLFAPLLYSVAFWA